LLRHERAVTLKEKEPSEIIWCSKECLIHERRRALKKKEEGHDQPSGRGTSGTPKGKGKKFLEGKPVGWCIVPNSESDGGEDTRSRRSPTKRRWLFLPKKTPSTDVKGIKGSPGDVPISSWKRKQNSEETEQTPDGSRFLGMGRARKRARMLTKKDYTGEGSRGARKGPRTTSQPLWGNKNKPPTAIPGTGAGGSNGKKGSPPVWGKEGRKMSRNAGLPGRVRKDRSTTNVLGSYSTEKT